MTAADHEKSRPAEAPDPHAARWLIVNADDFGLSAGVNAGVIAAHERGIVTSASLMVRWPAAVEAARYAVTHRGLSLGLHLDLGEWQCANGQWRPLYEVVPADDPAAAAAEARRQLETFRELAGANPTHIDSHQHVHRGDAVRGVVLDLATEMGIPARGFTPRIRYCGDFYGQTGRGEPWPEGISRQVLLRLLENLPPGITELGCHPGWDDELATMYRRERKEEVDVLCDPQVAAAIDRLGIRRISFASVGWDWPARKWFNLVDAVLFRIRSYWRRVFSAPAGFVPAERRIVHYRAAAPTLSAPAGVVPAERRIVHYRAAAPTLSAPAGLAPAERRFGRYRGLL